jgi:hypothetical protein
MSLELLLAAVNRTLKAAAGVAVALAVALALLEGLWLVLAGVEQAARMRIRGNSGIRLSAFRLRRL